ncbi:hypothetical protein Mx9_p64 [Myxococcus phage Mx9]|nr:hypothetical protein Mx9_p64 [Myxococcus phage Mx9]
MNRRMTGKQTATVKVRVVVEVNYQSAWGQDCSIGQVYDQGTRESVEQVRRLLETATGVRIVEAVSTDVVVRVEPER